jgi:hypothetical protein
MINDLTKTVFGDKLDKSYKFSDVLAELDELDLLNHGELAELAISTKSGVQQCAKLTENIDLVSGKQIKHAKTYFRNGSWIATVSRNTTAPMLIVITEQNTKKQYFLHIPYEAHRHLAGNTIGISFGYNGSSRNSHWFDYEVSSFDELCELAK